MKSPSNQPLALLAQNTRANKVSSWRVLREIGYSMKLVRGGYKNIINSHLNRLMTLKGLIIWNNLGKRAVVLTPTWLGLRSPCLIGLLKRKCLSEDVHTLSLLSLTLIVMGGYRTTSDIRADAGAGDTQEGSAAVLWGLGGLSSHSTGAWDRGRLLGPGRRSQAHSSLCRRTTGRALHS